MWFRFTGTTLTHKPAFRQIITAAVSVSETRPASGGRDARLRGAADVRCRGAVALGDPGVRDPGPEERFHARCGHRPGHEVALTVTAAHLTQLGELTRLLDALGHDLHAEVAAHLHDGLGEHRQHGVLAEAGDEGRV